jgi:hypothetical protein
VASVAADPPSKPCRVFVLAVAEQVERPAGPVSAGCSQAVAERGVVGSLAGCGADAGLGDASERVVEGGVSVPDLAGQSVRQILDTGVGVDNSLFRKSAGLGVGVLE